MQAAYTCCHCQKSKEGKRLPPGWHKHNGTHCDGCWKKKYVLRAVTIPVVRPLGEGVGWPELRVALRDAWGHCTSLANWALSQLFARDVHRGPDSPAKMPTMKRCYLYPEAAEIYKGKLAAQTVSSILQSVEAKYREKRYQTNWTGEASLASHRYPQPIVQHNQQWKPLYVPAGKDGGDEVPAVSISLGAGEDSDTTTRRWLLQLRGGREFRRQLADFRMLVEGRALMGQLDIIRKTMHGANRPTSGAARDSGGQQVGTQVLVKMVGWFPRRERVESSGVLRVHTDADCFLVALDEKDNKIRTWNADHIRRWVAEHTRRLNRWSDDAKAEQRPVPTFQSRREAACQKYRNRMKSFIQQVVAELVGVAARRRFAEITLDDSLRTYLPRFDWSGFRSRLAVVCDSHNIVLTPASGGVTQDSQAPLEVES